MLKRTLRFLCLKLFLPALGAAIFYCLGSSAVLAQTGVESGLMNRLPKTTVAPAGGSIGGSAGSTTSPGSPGTVEVSPPAPGEEGALPPAAGEETAPPPVPTAPTPAAHKSVKRSTTSHPAITHIEVEPAQARVRLKEDTWVLSRPAKSSKHVTRVHASKLVDVTGSTRYYLRVKLKDGREGYVPISAAADLVRPTDKLFDLTSDAAVLKEPNRWSKKVSEVHKGHKVHVVGVALNYMKIRMKSGLEGYIPTKALE
jgi:hypothetical protein